MTETLTLTNDMIVVLSILAFTIYLFAFEVVRVDLAAVIVMLVLGIGGVVEVESVFSGFSSNAVISIIAVTIMGAGLDKTGLMTQLAGFILKVGGSTEKRIIPIISGTVGVISSFMQNIGAAALFLPVVSRISTRTGLPLSRLLMPMGFCAILGGTMTMIGSSPLILLNDLIITSNKNLPDHVTEMGTFGLFDVTPVGFALVLTGIAYFVLAGRFVLPKTKPGGTADPGQTADYFEHLYDIKGDIFEARVTLGSPLVGKTIREAEEVPGAPVIVGIRNTDELVLAPPGDEMIWAGSTFALMGTEKEVRKFRSEAKLTFKKDLESFLDSMNPSRSGVAEVVIPPGSKLIGLSLIEIRMRSRYGVSVLAIHRGEETLHDQLRSLRFQAGDTLVMHCKWEDLHELSKDRNFVVVTDYPHEETRPKKVKHAIGFFVLALALVFLDYRLSLALFVGAAGMIATGVLTVDEAYKSVGWQSVFLLASLIPLGLAVETTGTAAWIAQETLHVIGDVPIWVLQGVIAVLATFFTLVMSNVGATVLLVPLAVNIAIGAGADPAMFALTVALATSNSFLIPTHQVNALIMGPAGYRVADFMRAGGVMTALFLVVMMVMLNIVF